jgi:hypothetical protein
MNTEGIDDQCYRTSSIMLLQVKGSSAKITSDELERLQGAVRNARIRWNVAEKPGKTAQFRRGLISSV